MRPARPEQAQADINSIAARRSPTQQRSRARVRQILSAAADLVVQEGVERLTTRSIARQAGVPVASLYQYFADKDDVILALVKDDTAEMDDAVANAIAQLRLVSIRTVVEATMRAFVEVYRQRPAFVVIWWRGRSNAAVLEFCRVHNRQIAATLFQFATEQGLVTDTADLELAELAVEVGDRVFEFAFADDIHGKQRIIDEGVELVTSYLQRHATSVGINGIALG